MPNYWPGQQKWPGSWIPQPTLKKDYKTFENGFDPFRLAIFQCFGILWKWF